MLTMIHKLLDDSEKSPRWLAASLVALLVVGSMACGAVVANEQVADEKAGEAADADAAPGFLAKIFTPDPVEVMVPAGTVIPVRFLDTLSSHETSVGASFRAEVLDPITVDGETAVPAGSRILGRVSEASKPKGIGGRARLSLDFHTLELPDGQSIGISAVFAARGKSEAGKDAAIIGGSTIGGAILGEAIDGGGRGDGDIVGGIVGGIAGAVGAVKTKGKPVVVPAGQEMTIELGRAVTVTV